MEKKLFERFMKINFKRQIKKCLELKKQSKEKAIKYMSEKKDYDNSFNRWINKKT